MSPETPEKAKAKPQPKSSLMSFLVFLIFVGAAGSVVYRIMDRPEFRFARNWKHDFDLLENAKQLPEGFKRLRSIKVTSTSPKIKDLAQKLTGFIPTNSSGEFDLEIFFDPMTEHKGILVQYDLVDVKSGNTVFEISRTLPITF